MIIELQSVHAQLTSWAWSFPEPTMWAVLCRGCVLPSVLCKNLFVCGIRKLKRKKANRQESCLPTLNPFPCLELAGLEMFKDVTALSVGQHVHKSMPIFLSGDQGSSCES